MCLRARARVRVCANLNNVTLITGRNEVVAKVMFLHVSVILFTGGVSRQGEPPPQTRQGDLPDQADPLEQTLPDQADPPGTRHTPPEQAGRPPGKQTSAYGQRAAGMHPTGMHSCFGNFYHLQTKFVKVMFLHLLFCPQGGEVSRPRPRGDVQAQAWGGLCPGGCPGQDLGVSAQGRCPGPGPGCVEAHGGCVSQHAVRQTPPSRQLLLQMVRILLECILVLTSFNYHPQMKFAKIMFLHLSVILFTGGVCLSA